MAAPPILTAEWIGEQLRAHRIQQKELARALDLAPSGVTRLLSGERKLRAREVDIVVAFFSRYLEEVPRIYVPGPHKSASGSARGKGRPGYAPVTGMRDRVPVYAGLAARAAGEEPVEWREAPAQLRAARDVFGFFVDDDGLAPILLAGDLAYVHPGRPARDRTRVLALAEDGSIEAGLLLRHADGRDLQVGERTRRLGGSERIQVIAAIETV